MALFDESQYPYNDKFDAKKLYSKILYRPDRPIFQSELNESQSMFQNQLRLLGNSLHKDGDILSGMNLVPQGVVSTSSPSTIGKGENLITYSTLTSYNSKIDTGLFTQDGSIDVATTATQEKNYPGLQFSVNGVTDTNFTVRFKIKRTSGTLAKIAGIYDKNLVVSRFSIDGTGVQTPLNSMDSKPLISDTGSQVNLSDGNEHEVVITFKTANQGNFVITIIANPGYNALTDGKVNFRVTELKGENGDTASKWSLAPSDANTSDGSTRNQIMKVTDGQVYLNGAVCYFNEQTINITGKGEETIGVSLDEDVVTSSMDSSLVDTTAGAPTQWHVGADRLHYMVNLTYNDKNSSPIYILKDGKQDVDVNKPDLAVLNDILAVRTNDESGSYRVSGFQMWSEPNQTDSSEINAVIEAGRAYVLGYQIIKSYPTRVPINKATEISKSGNESFYYSSVNDDAGILNNQPVKEVDRVTADIQVDDEGVSRNSNTTAPDLLQNSQVFKIVRIHGKNTDNKDVDFVEGVDFKLQQGNQILWDFNSKGSQPIQGSTYYVTYQYTQVLTRGKDYDTVVTGQDELQQTKVSFKDFKGLKPIENSLVRVDYQYFLARMDVISLNKAGEFVVREGQPAPLTVVQPPQQQDPLTLRIGYVLVYPNSSKATTVEDTVTRIPFSGLQDISNRVTNAEYNLAQDELRNKVMENEDPITLRDTFSDNFDDIQKGDIANKDFTAAYDIASNEITLANRASAAVSPDYDESASSIHKFMHMVTAPFTEYAIASQTIATGVINVNPYQNFNVLGTLVIDPAVDSWVNETDHEEIKDIQSNKPLQINRWWYHGGDNYASGVDGLTGGQFKQIYHREDGKGWTGWDDTFRAYKEETSTNIVNSVIEYARPRTINFKGSNFNPLTDNLVMTIDGRRVDMVPKNTANEGTVPGTVRTDIDGIVEGTFQIPERTVRTGTREVKLSNGSDQAITTYQSNGTQRDIIKTITRTHVTLNSYDPVAESFKTPQNTVLTGVRVYFATKPKTKDTAHKSAITLQIRNTDTAGYPTNEIIAEKTLQPEDVQVSKDASIPTEFVLDDPSLMSPTDTYVLALITDSGEYNVFMARQGQRRLDNNTILTSKGYTNGVMFTSSIASAWTTEQTMDLKFDVMAARFSPTGSIVFKTIYPKNKFYLDGKGNPILGEDGKPLIMDADKLLLMATYLTPDNTGLSWEIKVVTDDQPGDVTVDTVPWEPINNYIGLDLLAHAREIQLKASFVSSLYSSPILALDDLSLVTFLTELDGSYISRTIDMSLAKFNYLKVEYQAAAPEGSSVEAYYSLDGGINWVQLEVTNTKTINREYTDYVCEKLLHDQTKGDMALEKSIKFRIHLHSKEGFIRPKVRRLSSTMHEEDGTRFK